MKTRLLTLSDIHFKEDYAENELINGIIESFKLKVQEINAEHKIDFALLSGDLAYSGNDDEYPLLLDKIKSCFNNIRVFSVVGNHDVDWTYLKEALGRDNKLEKLFDIPRDAIVKDLNNSKGKFKKVFSHFGGHFEGPLKKINELIPNSDPFKYRFHPTQKCGYVFFESSCLLILLLNSAWYSFGPGVINSYYDDKFSHINEKGFQTLKEEVKELLGEKLSQIGKQSYFYNKDHFPYFKDITEIIEQNKDVRVISVAHHPPFWLKEKEQFSNDQKSISELNQLLSSSDILITGHTHSPIGDPSIINNLCHHVSNGAFLDYHYIDNQLNETLADKFPSNWFTVIDITNNTFNISSYRLNSQQKVVGRQTQNVFTWEKIGFVESIKFLPKEPVAALNLPPALKSSFLDQPQVDVVPVSIANISDLIVILKEQRLKEFDNHDEDISDANNLYEISSDNETYFVIINTLINSFKKLSMATEFSELVQDPFWGSLYSKLTSLPKGSKLPIIAFYDFISTNDGSHISESDKIYSDFYQKQFALFQSFKHYFFEKFEELYTFTELNIIYDCFIKKK
ncbi:MAG: metallophosphoesterase family protein [Bacteroidota bacterium]